VTEIVNKYERIIVLEDDLVTSPYFLQYMNDGLNVYKDCEEVISIHGYIYPVSVELPETFFIKGADCWGWATWKRGWDLFEPNGEKLLNEIIKRGLTYQFDFNGSYPYTQMLKDQIAGLNNSWAIRWNASAFLKNKLTLYPGKSLVQNIGNDGTGTHSGTSNTFNINLYSSSIIVDNNTIKPSQLGYKAFVNFFMGGDSVRSVKKKKKMVKLWVKHIWRDVIKVRLNA
ncbi:MAG: glycosyltransferase family 2 protein, partial [Daejeonella sp.]